MAETSDRSAAPASSPPTVSYSPRSVVPCQAGLEIAPAQPQMMLRWHRELISPPQMGRLLEMATRTQRPLPMSELYEVILCTADHASQM